MSLGSTKMNQAFDDKFMEKLKEENPTCWECKGKPDFIYFNDKTLKILSVICEGCKKTIEGTLLFMGKPFCTTPNCQECKDIDKT